MAEVQETLGFIKKSGNAYFYDSARSVENNLLDPWIDEGYVVEGSDLVLSEFRTKTERELVLAEGSVMSLIDLSRKLRQHFRNSMQKIHELESKGIIKRTPRVTRRRLPAYHVLRDVYATHEIEYTEEIDRIPIVRLSFHVYPTGEYTGKKSRTLALRVEKVFILGERPPKGKSLSDVLNKIDWTSIEDELIDFAQGIFHSLNPESDFTSSKWMWYVGDENNFEVDLKKLVKGRM